jgi:ATP-dependent protease HslVU (ClpYQ) ATPase subunit
MEETERLILILLLIISKLKDLFNKLGRVEMIGERILRKVHLRVWEILSFTAKDVEVEKIFVNNEEKRN